MQIDPLVTLFGNWVGPLLGLIGVVISATLLYRSATRNTKTAETNARQSAKEKLNADIDARVEKQLREAWDVIAGLKDEINVLTADAKKARAAAAVTDARDVLLYRYTRNLHDHIVSKLPPPPPELPIDLQDWYEEFERTDPPHPFAPS